MAPDVCSCLLGTYRGESTCPSLVDYEVHIKADPRVGVESRLVANAMAAFGEAIHRGCAAYEDLRTRADSLGLEQAVLLLKLVETLAMALEWFLRIHPYANGNGHVGRLLVWVLLTRYGYPPSSWPLEESVEYSTALSEYRNANKRPLVVLLLRHIGTDARNAWLT
jgi:hypothetical protein